jgi:hypothetical protein
MLSPHHDSGEIDPAWHIADTGIAPYTPDLIVPGVDGNDLAFVAV